MDGALDSTQGSPADRPEIRQDLNLYPVGEGASGERIWHLHDPLANKFYQMREKDVELLALIGHKTAQEVAKVAGLMRQGSTTDEEVETLVEFLRRNNLVRGDDLQKGYYYEALAHSRERHWWELAVRNPLFFRIPLWNPDRFLDRALPYVAWVGSRSSILVFFVLGVLGIYLVQQQIDLFLATFLHFFSWSGLAVYLVALFFVKIFHELGHAFSAKRLGCRVPVIGVAFMVGWPILYTDTSDAWKIPDRKKRLRIGVAGVGVELVIAVLSLFLWAISPEGALRSVFFLLASTTWILSVLVNFNPLMRFDGYYLFSDLIDTPNLESRAFDMAKWWLREKLFGLGAEPPEEVRYGLVLFAFSVWLYRFLLFLGIALLIYGFFFKAAGLALFAVEIVFFIVMPVVRELKVWWALRDEISMNSTFGRTLVVIVVASGILFIPWQSDVSTPAILKARSSDLYLHVAGQLLKSSRKAEVLVGDTVFEFESPELSLEIEEASNRFEELSWIRASLGFDEKLRNERLIVESDLMTQRQRLHTLVEESKRLNISVPFSGRIVDRSPELMPGDWLPVGTKLATVVDSNDTRVIAYLPESQLVRVEAGMNARFYPENPEFGVRDLIVSEIEFMGTPELDNLYLASSFGGDVAVRESGSGELLTVQSYYKVYMDSVEEKLSASQVVRGVAVIDGHSVSLFSQIKRRFVAIFIRETGF
ncbi:MAG: HlyD family efflux transporter periplasmic adaptor subunit [Gammaproteobacteria bacterium]|jgi:putative peptide zinc metalloprotease protein|nr:HlyD family efflux transporter periplasmic adaptor subunit [Gammaproteobacteria bacterium]MBT7369608.1 HlyD family efflux transporter periplasmic adaptor subunit [Gammaproteobacteria bacterium]